MKKAGRLLGITYNLLDKGDTIFAIPLIAYKQKDLEVEATLVVTFFNETTINVSIKPGSAVISSKFNLI